MNFQLNSFSKLALFFGALLICSFAITSCQKDEVSPVDEGLVSEMEASDVALTSNTVGDYVIKESDTGELIYDFSATPEGTEKTLTTACEFRVCLKVNTDAVVFVQFPGAPAPLKFCGPFKDCITLTGLSPLPITSTITYVGTGGAVDQIDGYPAGGPISFPPDVTLNFPATANVVCEQRMVQFTAKCKAIEVADM